jgi:predicted PurR-regulated permease PerM
MSILYLYFLWGFALTILVGVLVSLADRKTIGYPSARWGATLAFATVAIPVAQLIGWPFATGLALLMCTVINYVIWGIEQISIELAKRKQREAKANSL